MAKHELSFVFRARNFLMAGVAGARRTLMQFGGWVSGLGKRMSLAFLGASASLGGFIGLASRAYAKQERSEKALASALAVHGDAADDLLPKLKKVAAAIQDQTGVGDEQTLSTMANLRMLGVQADMLEQAAKATIALKSANVDETAAAKMVALATVGQYTMLSRYLPALRTAKTEAEKAAAVNDFLSRGYQQQAAMLGTSAGAWSALKGRIGDALEEFGKAINNSRGLTRLLELAGNAVKGFGEKVAAYIDSERFRSIQESVQGILQAIGGGGDNRREVFTAFSEALRAAFALAAAEAVSVIKKGANEIGSTIGAAFRKHVSVGSATKATLNMLNPISGMFKQAKWIQGKLESPANKTVEAFKDPQVEEAQRRLTEAATALYSVGRENYTAIPPKVEIPAKAFSIAGSGIKLSEAAATGISDYLQNAISRMRDMGNDVEQYAARTPFTAERQQERLANAAEENNRLMERNNELMQEQNDLLTDNLSQG